VNIDLLPGKPRTAPVLVGRSRLVGIVQGAQVGIRVGAVDQRCESVRKDPIADQHQGLVAGVQEPPGTRVSGPPRRVLSLFELGRHPVEAPPRGKPRETRGVLRPRIDLVDRQKANQEVPPAPRRLDSLVLDHCGKGLHHSHLR